MNYINKNENRPSGRDTKNKGCWLSHQFEQYKKGEMSVERKDKFDKYDLIDIKKWNINRRKRQEYRENLDEQWLKNLKIVLQYKNNNNKNPLHRDTKNKGKWLFNQFEYYRKGTMPENRKEEFDKYNLIDKNQWNTIEDKAKIVKVIEMNNG